MAITLHHHHLSGARSSSHTSTWTTTVAPAIQRALQTLWRVMEAYGEQRASQHMFRLAGNYEHTSPVLASQMRATARSISA